VRQKRTPLPAILLAIAVAALALTESAVAIVRRLRGPVPDADWRAAADLIRAAFQPGDLIVFAPAWVDPVGRQFFGDLIPVEMAARADDDRYARIWEVSIRGARSPEVAGWTLAASDERGRVRLRRYDRPGPPATVLYDVTSQFPSLRVTTATPDGANEQTCPETPTPGGPAVPARACAPNVLVQPRVLEIDYQPRRGILAPAIAGRVVRVEAANVPLGGELVGYVGLHDFNMRKYADGPVDFAVFIDGKERTRFTYRQSENWRKFVIDTKADAGPGHTLRFEISSPQPDRRTFGFHAEVRK
jgi:hypothetical protein